jgi:MFS family permease
MLQEKGGSYPSVYYVMVFIGFSFVLGMGLASAFLPILALELDPSGMMVGYVVSAWFLTRVFIELPSGVISDRIGRRRLLIFGIALSSVGSLLCAIANSIYLLIVGRGLWGFGAALFFLNNTAILIDLFKSKRRGRALGTFQGIQFVGSLIGAPLGAFFASLIGYSSVFYITFGILCLSLILAFTSKELKEVGASSSSSNSQPSIRKALASLLDRNILVICVICFSRMFIITGAMSTVFPLYLFETLGFNVSVIGVITAARTGGFIVATIASGYLSDRFGRKIVILAGLLIEIPCLYIYTVTQSFGLITVVGILDGVGAGLVSATLIVLLSEIVKPEFRGVSIGLYRTFLDIGGIAGPIVFIIIATQFGIYLSFYIGAVILALMVCLTVLIKRKEKVKKI